MLNYDSSLEGGLRRVLSKLRQKNKEKRLTVNKMNNAELQNIIGSWFPNPEAGNVSEVVPISETEDGLEESAKAKAPINPSLLEFTEEESQFLNIRIYNS